MDVRGTWLCDQDAGLKTAPDDEWQAASNHGNLAPACDGAVDEPGPVAPSRTPSPRALIVTITIGAALALLVGSLSRTQATRARSTYRFVSTTNRVSLPVPSAANPRQLDRLNPQAQAETLLELAVAHSDAAAEQIFSRLDRWQGQLQWDSQMATLTTAALNSNDMRVRVSGIEVELAAYGLSKDSASLQRLLKSCESSDHAEKIWALWASGLMGNRGVETARVVQVLTTHVRDSDLESRHWAVQGLAVTGTGDAIPILLTAMHDDPSPLIRQAAACGLAQSGMFTHEQRLTAVPQLLQYTDDLSLDDQTHAWAFQALREISGRPLPDDPSGWRDWYASSLKPSGN